MYSRGSKLIARIFEGFRYLPLFRSGQFLVQSVPFKSRVNYESQLFFSLRCFETFVAKVQIIKLSVFSSMSIKFVYHLV